MSTTSPTPVADRRRRPEQTRLDLLEAAAEAIAAHGYHGMSMRKLAQSCGRSLGNFYNHFPSKDAVLHALQRDAFEELIANAERAAAGLTDPAARLHAFVLQHVRYVADHPARMRVLVHEASALPPGPRAEVRALKERYFALLRDIVADLRPDDDGAETERATYTVFGMLNWLYGWYVPARHGDPPTVARTIHRTALCGLGDT